MRNEKDRITNSEREQEKAKNSRHAEDMQKTLRKETCKT
jgi:hypothetical protein